MERFQLTKTCVLTLQKGDITKAAVDAIVNAANERMLGGGGVDGAIHRAAGAELFEACHAVKEVRPGVRCPTGEARLTPGFALPAHFVIHTVGPIYDGAARSAPLLSRAYASVLSLAGQHGLKSVAFPAISCGVYGYPLDEAADVALKACRKGAGALSEVRFVLFSDDVLEAWRQAATELLAPA